MSMLVRYKKTGGFVQLLALIESFAMQKREKFMEMIQQEDPAWAKAISGKILTVERILTWPEQTVAEIFRTLPVKNLAAVMKGISPESAEKIRKFMGHAELRKLDDEMGALEVKPDEIFATFVKVVEMTRKMIKERQIAIEKIDPDMDIPTNIETTLAQESSNPGPSAQPAPAQKATPVMVVAKAPPAAPKMPQDIGSLRRAYEAVTKENLALKEEVCRLREQLAQARKAA